MTVDSDAGPGSGAGFAPGRRSARTAVVDDPDAARRGGRDVLSLLLIDARNHLLQHLQTDAATPALLRQAARAAAFQEHWITCHLQRQRGEHCDPQAVRLAGIEPRAAGWVDDDGPLPALADLQRWLADSLEITLDLLQRRDDRGDGDDSDAWLHVYRAALWHEDRLCEAIDESLRLPAPRPREQRPALAFAAQRWPLGSAAAGGYVPHVERWAHAVEVPDFEIDAQPVTWSAFVEFAEDGGYDRPEIWSAAGARWLQQQGARAPRHVEQLAGGVLLQRPQRLGGGLQRVPGHQPAAHLSRFEAEAWCQWAGRRLPTEPEWEIAAATPGQGFAWGDVAEWVAGSARLWPGAGSPPPADASAHKDPQRATAVEGAWGVLRGASAATRLRWHHPKARRFTPLDGGDAGCGFRSCAI